MNSSLAVPPQHGADGVMLWGYAKQDPPAAQAYFSGTLGPLARQEVLKVCGPF
jgi:hypothetical protein